MGKHLEDGAVHAVDGHGGQAEPDDAHVGNAGIANHIFQIGLLQADKDAIDNSNGGQQRHELRPILPPFRAQKNRDPQNAEGADLHQDPGMDHRYRSGRGETLDMIAPHVAPGVKTADFINASKSKVIIPELITR